MLEQSWKKVYSRATTTLIALLQPKHGFCQQNGPECGQAQDWHPNEKMVVIPVSSNGLCCSSEVLESLPLLAFRRDVVNAIFLKYSKESRPSSSHLGIRNVPSDYCYDNAKHYQVPFEKQGRCKVCKKNSRRCCVKCKVHLYMNLVFFWLQQIFH